MSRLQETLWNKEVVQPERLPLRPAQLSPDRRIALMRFPWLRSLLLSRWAQFLVRSLTFAGFIFAIAVGFFATPVGGHNFAIIFVWIIWWSAWKLFFLPLGGRSWCSICPLPLPGEWLQRGGVLEKTRSGLGLNLRWPKRLKTAWLPLGGFLVIGLFSTLILTTPRATAWVLLSLIALATLLSLIFERRTFCRYLCPIGAFNAMYARLSPLELRVVSPAVCAAHGEKTCYQNCAWGLYPLALRDSSQCALCMECLRVCPLDNIAVNLRPFGSGLLQPPQSARLDDALLTLVMLSSALAFSAVYVSPFGGLKLAAFEIGSLAWWVYTLVFLVFNLLLIPGLFTLAVCLTQKGAAKMGSLRQAVPARAQVLLPLSLFSWIAFTVSFSLPKLDAVAAVLADPLALGWKLLPGVSASWYQIALRAAPFLAVAFLLVGLFWSARLVSRVEVTMDRRSAHREIPLLLFCLAYTSAMFWVLIG